MLFDCRPSTVSSGLVAGRAGRVGLTPAACRGAAVGAAACVGAVVAAVFAAAAVDLAEALDAEAVVGLVVVVAGGSVVVEVGSGSGVVVCVASWAEGLAAVLPVRSPAAASLPHPAHPARTLLPAPRLWPGAVRSPPPDYAPSAG